MALVGLALAGALAMWWVRRRYLVVTVRGESMLPAYRPGERVLVRRTPIDEVDAGQVVVLRDITHDRPGTHWIIKRVAAVPGDPAPRATVPALQDDRVPAGCLVVLGDNPARSHDSRHTGYLTADRLFGVVLRKIG
jgi:signal peptidase I